MIRTKIYLTAPEVQGVARVASTTGRKQSEVILEAIDQYLSKLGPQDRLGRLNVGEGIWSGHGGIDLNEIRKDFDRF